MAKCVNHSRAKQTNKQKWYLFTSVVTFLNHLFTDGVLFDGHIFTGDVTFDNQADLT